MTDLSQQSQLQSAGINATEPNDMGGVPNALKAFVIVSGIIIVIGAILLTVLIIFRAGNLADKEVTMPSAPVDLALPEGARVSQVIADGRRLVLLAEDEAGQQYLAVVNSASGERLSLIRITPSP